MESDEKEFLHSNITHRYYVGYFLSRVIEELTRRAVLHDVSKYSDSEFQGFIQSAYYVLGPWGKENIPDEVRKRLRESMTKHHEANDHHPEHFQCGMEDMDLIQLLEMAIDWKSAMIRHGNFDIEENVRVGQTRFGYPDFFAKILVNTLKRIQAYEPEAKAHKPDLF